MQRHGHPCTGVLKHTWTSTQLSSDKAASASPPTCLPCSWPKKPYAVCQTPKALLVHLRSIHICGMIHGTVYPDGSVSCSHVWLCARPQVAQPGTDHTGCHEIGLGTSPAVSPRKTTRPGTSLGIQRPPVCWALARKQSEPSINPGRMALHEHSMLP